MPGGCTRKRNTTLSRTSLILPDTPDVHFLLQSTRHRQTMSLVITTFTVSVAIGLFPMLSLQLPNAFTDSGTGAGRRLCPGIHLAERNLFIAMAKLLWAFSFE